MTTRFDQDLWICGAQAEICGFGGGSSGGAQPAGNTTSTQTTDPWSGQQPYLNGTNGVFPTAQAFYTGGGTGFDPANAPQYYTGTNTPGPQNTVADFTPQQTTAINAASNLAMGDPTTAAATANSQAFLTGQMMPGNNPYYQQMAATTLGNVVPGLEAQFNQGNSMNNPGLAYAVSQGATDALGNIGYQAYNQGLTNQIQAQALAPQIQNLGFNDANLLYNAGAQQQGQTQSDINAAVNQWNYNQTLPMEMFNQYANAVQGGYGSTSTLTQPYFENQTANALGGAVGGGLLGNMLTGGSTTGTAGGAGLGALLSIF